MKNRYEKFVIKEEKVVQQTNEKSIIELVLTNTHNYENPPIPKGYKHICGEWNNGFVIERCSDGSQFVWVPVGCFDSNVTLDLNSSIKEFHEKLTDEIVMQIESVNKYGGFYISRYIISESQKGKPQSVAGKRPWVYINRDDAKKVAATIEDNETVKSHLPYEVEYALIQEWFIKSNARAHDLDTKNSLKKVFEKCIYNIYVFAGDVKEWIQSEWKQKERKQDEWTGDREYCAIQCGFFHDGRSFCIPAINRFFVSPNNPHPHFGFRAALYIK